MASRLKTYRDRKAALVKQMETLLNTAHEDGERDLTEEETQTYQTHEKELAGLNKKIEFEEHLQEQERSLDASYVPDPNKKTTVSNATPAFVEDPKKGFKTPREFLAAVMDAGRRGEVRDERLKYLAAAGSDEQGGYSDSIGGFLTPVGLSPGLLQIQPEADPLGGRTTQIPMTAPTVKLNSRVDKDHRTSVSGGLVVTRRAETQTQGASRMLTEQVTLEAASLFGLSFCTEELLTDSVISFVALLEAGFRDQFTSHMINERLNGTGVGEFMGVLNSPCLVEVAKEADQAADTINFENVVKMRSRCWRYGQALWMYNPDCLPQLLKLYMPIGTANGAAVWLPSMRDGEPDLLLGRPAVPSEYCSTLGDKGDLILGVWSEFLEGTYEPLQSAESIHVRFVNHERTFKFWMRNAGAPWWKSTLQPKKGANTLSPFVCLAARA